MKEEWRLISNYGYYVSNLGRVRKHDRIVSQWLGGKNNERWKVDLGEDGKWFVHLLVLLAFVGPKPEGMVGDHIDRDKRNNRLTNLRYITQEESDIQYCTPYGPPIYPPLSSPP